MGLDFAQENEWDVMKSLDWHLCDEPGHRDVLMTVRSLLSVYRENPVLYTDSKDSNIFEWVNRNYADANIISYIRKKPRSYEGAILVICNFSPWFHHGYACGVPMGGEYTRLFSTYDHLEGGGQPKLYAEHGHCDGRPFRLNYGLRPYECIIVKMP